MKPQATSEDFVFIDLDDPAPWWSSMVGAIAAILIAGVLIAPWVIDLDDGQSESLTSSAMQNPGSICRPNAEGLPGAFDPSVASWSRFCDWFIAPGLEQQDNP